MLGAMPDLAADVAADVAADMTALGYGRPTTGRRGAIDTISPATGYGPATGNEGEPMGLLDGKVALVTGAARGQGRAHCVRLAGEGADIVALDLCQDLPGIQYPMATADDLDETVDLVKQTGRRVVKAVADVRSLSAMRAAVAAAVDELGGIDILVANAGVAGLGLGQLSDAELEETWDSVVDTNLKGVWATVLAVGPAMVARGGGGSMILISSSAGLKGLTSPGAFGNEGYGASKHGVVGLMRQFAVEFSPHSIRVNSIHPTGVNTMMVNNEAMNNFFAQFPDAANSISNLLPIGVLEPEDISDSVVYLASDMSRYVTGVTLSVDAGFNVK